MEVRRSNRHNTGGSLGQRSFSKKHNTFKMNHSNLKKEENTNN